MFGGHLLDISRKFYKYGRVNEYAEALFTTSQVFFESPGNLNDPFECRPWIALNRSDPLRLMDSLKALARRQDPGRSEADVTALAKTMFDAPGEESMDALRKVMIENIDERVGIYCMTERRDSIVMWSHYADGHRGYCLEFDARNKNERFGAARPVEYVDQYPAFEAFQTSAWEQPEIIFFKKHTGWEYEAEWRVIDYVHGPGLKDYPPELLTSVILGMNMSDEHEANIREWVEQRGHPVKFYRARRDEREFRLHIVDA